jgi:ubiquinone/menaquinone biosynthesis C-methylase UbiE
MSPTPGRKPNFVPALHFDRLTNFYDFFVALTMRETSIKNKLIDYAEIKDGDYSLDVGSGTGTLALMIKKRCPEAQVVGLDIDRRVLYLAKRKSNRAKLEIALVQASAVELPFSSGTFDHVFSSLVYHHLSTDQKVESMREIVRVLKPGGRFLLADFGKPHNFFMNVVTKIMQKIENITDNVLGLLPVMMKQAGFYEVTELDRFSSPFGTITFYTGKKSK